MSKLYTNVKEGISYISGRIQSISDDRKQAVVGFRTYDSQSKKWSDDQKTIQVPDPLAEDYKKGNTVTAVGYVLGKNFQPLAMTKEAMSYEMTPELELVTGHVKSCEYRSEVDQEGKPYMTKNNTPKKAHYDITVSCPRDDGIAVDHVMRVYESQFQKIEDISKRFDTFQNPEETPIFMTCITKPGNEWTKEGEDGTVSHRVYHLGIRNLDINYEYDRSKFQAKDAEQTQEAPTQAQAAPAAPAQNAPATPAPAAPTQAKASAEVEGFEVSDDSFEAEFN